MSQFDSIALQADQEIAQCQEVRSLEDLRVKYMGKKGTVTEQLKTINQLPPAERSAVGQELNKLKTHITSAIENRRQALDDLALQASLSQQKIDVTAPGKKQGVGGLHPITQVLNQVEDLFSRIGFEVKEGPEIEDDFHNFEALNIAADHPARTMHDTFYLNDSLLLRTHTSPVQVRVMKDAQPPIRMIAPGRVYRRDLDPTHSPMFHQVEGLVIDAADQMSFAHLKGLVNTFLRAFFEGEEIQIRFRPSYFPFTEPSAEIDICRHQNGEWGDWLEVMGCGMIHPNVLKASGIDAEDYDGYAFGLGIERLAMLKYGINDLRVLFENHLAVIAQFK